jgi:hypothetical protein
MDFLLNQLRNSNAVSFALCDAYWSSRLSEIEIESNPEFYINRKLVQTSNNSGKGNAAVDHFD